MLENDSFRLEVSVVLVLMVGFRASFLNDLPVLKIITVAPWWSELPPFKNHNQRPTLRTKDANQL